MLTDVTVNVPPRPDMSLELDGLDVLGVLGDDEDGDEDDAPDDAPDAPLPENRPMTITWWPTCSARFTPESAISRSSFMLPERLELDMLPDDDDVDGLLDDGLPAGGVPACAPSLLALGLVELLVVLLLEPLPNFAFFRTKLPPLPAVALLDELLLDGLVLDVSLLAPPARCRQPVALIEPAVEPVDDCGVDDVGLCAASVPHSATAVLSVTAHCQ